MASAARTEAACLASVTREHDYVAMVGKARSHVSWALAAALAGDDDRVLLYIRQAAEALGVDGPSPYYVPGIPVSFARQHSEEAF